jgi:hypothetical protein
MEQQLATETPNETDVAAAQKPASPSLLESWATNERMRHVPNVDWLIWKVDVDLRSRLEKVLSSFQSAPVDSPARAQMEGDLRALCRAFDRLADVARHTRTNGQNGDPSQRVIASLNNAVTNLRTLDSSVIGRRFPFQTFERSKSEPLYGALLMALDFMQRLISHARTVDRNVDERLLAGLVTLQNPVDDRMLKPIA